MKLPFSPAQFFEVFRLYNEAVWPLQLALVALAFAALVLAWTRHRHAGRLVSLILAALWAWMAVVYHLVYFRPVNPAATLFGAAFLLGAAAFAWDGVVRNRLHFDRPHALGYALVAYALVVYPLLALLLGHRYPAAPTFGLPCPTTIFTIGMLAFLRPPYGATVFIVPVLWTLVGAQAALQLGVYEDAGLVAAGITGLWLAFHARRTHEQPLVP